MSMLDVEKGHIVVGKNGRVVLPAKVRESLGIEDGDALKYIVVNGIIQIEKVGN